MTYYEQNSIDEVRNATDIVDVISEYVVLKRKGRNYVGLCPFHHEKTPSFTVSQEKQIYHCFGCNAGGDVFRFLMSYSQLDFSEALEELAARAGITLNKAENSHSPVKNKDKRTLEINLEAARFFYKYFNAPQGKDCVAYLIGRGINGKTRETFKLGYAPESWDLLIKHLLEQGFTLEEQGKSGLIGRSSSGKYYSMLRDRLVFPIENMKGEIIGFGGRVIGKGEPKYLNSPETSCFQKKYNLYALNLAKDEMRRTSRALLMEGYMDVIMSHQYGFTNAVASLGTAFTKEQARLLSRYVKEVIVVFDMDDAGRKAVEKAVEAFSGTDILVRIANLGDAKDPDEYIKKYGKDSFENVMTHSLPVVEYFLRMGQRKYNMGSIEDKVTLINELFPYIGAIDNTIKQNEYLKLIVEELGLDPDSLNFEFKKFKESENLNKNKEEIRQEKRKEKKVEEKISDGQNKGELEILKIILSVPELYEKYRKEISEINFESSFIKEIFVIIDGFAEKRENWNIPRLLELVNESQSKVITAIASSDGPLGLFAEDLQAWLIALRKRDLKKTYYIKLREIHEAEKEGNEIKLTNLKNDIIHLQNEMDNLC